MIEITNTSTLQDLKNKYVFSDKFIDGLEIGFKTGNNLLAYGPGGHGKSEISEDFFKLKNIEPFIFCMGNGTSIDRVFGGMDHKEFKDTGKINYLVENSFMNYEYVIFEELFDAPAEVLEQLKDVLSSGYLRQGGQKFQVKTKYIVCCSNKTRLDFTKGSASLKALMERFPLEIEVKWKNYNAITYSKLIETKLGSNYDDPFFSYLLEQFAQQQTIISPRIALKGAELLHNCGVDCLDYLGDFLDKKDILDKAKEAYAFKKEFNIIRKEIEGLLTTFDTVKDTAKEDELKTLKDRLVNQNFKLGGLPTAKDGDIEEFATLTRKVKLEIEAIESTIKLHQTSLENLEEAYAF